MVFEIFVSGHHHSIIVCDNHHYFLENFIVEKKNTFTYHQKPVNTTTGSRNLPGCGNRQQEWLQSHSGGSSSKTVKLPALAIEQQSYLVQQGYGNAHCPIAKQVHADCRKLDRSVLLNQPKRTNLYAPLHPIDSNATDICKSSS